MAKEYESRRFIPPVKTGLPSHIAYEIFEYSKYSAIGGTGKDWEAMRSYAFAMYGEGSMRMRPKASSPAANDYVQASAFLPLLPFTEVDVSCDFLIEGTPHDYIAMLTFGSPYISKDEYYAGSVYVYTDTGQVIVIDDTGTQRLIGTLADVTEKKFIHLEATINFAEKKYKSVRLGGYDFDASMHKIMTTPGGIAYNYANFGVANQSTNRATIYFDDITAQAYTA